MKTTTNKKTTVNFNIHFLRYIFKEGSGWEILEEILSVRKAIESVLVARLVDWDTSEMGELTKKLFKFTDKKYKYSVRRLGPAEDSFVLIII